MLQRRVLFGCSKWLISCSVIRVFESSDAQNAQQVSLATPPKLWQAVKIDIFELEDSQRKVFFALFLDCSLQTVVMLMLFFFFGL